MLANKTDWSSVADQKLWFDEFKCKIEEQQEGLNFCQFQELLNASVYKLFSTCSQDIAFHSNCDQKDDEILKFSHEQELQLFNVFDTKCDHMIDSDEFSFLCANWLYKIYNVFNALVVVDVQNDFIDGSLALINGPAGQDGAEVVPVINELLGTCNFNAVVYTQDWHPSDHIAFFDNLHLRKYQLKEDVKTSNKLNGNELDSSNRYSCYKEPETDENNDTSNNNSKVAVDKNFRYKKLATEAKLFDIVLFDDGKVEQKLWPIHCIQNSWGAELHPKLNIVPDAIRIQKGTLSNVDAYSAFWDNSRFNETGLRSELTTRGVNEVFFCGLALDYCVAASALDSVRSGFLTCVIEDACRGIDHEEIQKLKSELSKAGAILTSSDTVQQYCQFLLDNDRNYPVKKQYVNKRDGGSESYQGLLPFLKEVCFRKGVMLSSQ